MLAESAATAGGAVSMLNAGWMVRPPEPVAPCALVVVLSIPRDEAGPHAIRLELQDSKGEIVVVPDGGEGTQLVIEQEVAVTGRDDVDPDLPLLLPFSAMVGPFPLEPGSSYRWRLSVDGEAREGWSVAFRTTPP
jgi:hypothetical protein